MEKDVMEQFQILTGMMESMMERMATKEDLDAAIAESETRTKVYMENTITKRLDALTDGYKLNHEKQYELERRADNLEAQIQDLQTRLTRLENQKGA